MLKKIFRESYNLIIKFVKSYGLNDEVLKIPKGLKKMGMSLRGIGLISTIIVLAFSYMLKFANLMIEAKFILLGILLFMLYKGEQIIQETFNMIRSSEEEKFQLVFDDEIVLRGSKIIAVVSEKVLKLDKDTKVYKVLTNETALNVIKNYLNNLWTMNINKVFYYLEVISVVAMLVMSIITNTAISQTIFIPLILSFALLSFLSSSYISISRDEYYKKHREYDDEQYVISNDLLRTPMVVRKDLTMRIGKFKESVEKSNLNLRRFHKKINKSHLVMSIVETLSSYGIILLYLFGVDWKSIDLGTIAEITANLAIVETALGYIRRMAKMLEGNAKRVGVILKEEEDMKLILDVYNKQLNIQSEEKHIHTISIPPFSMKYVEESENDKPFTLKSMSPIKFCRGEIALLYGISGSGKSTFMKMLTERIKIQKTEDIPSTTRYLYYDEKMKLGSLSIFEEIFCSDENPDLDKMQEILENLHLWQEISANCFDIWQYFKEKKYDLSLSNGQKQRLILAKMLYWLDEEIDVVALDECTSGLDDKSDTVESADAQRILEYIVRYCNKDKKRIVIISTHQSIEEFKTNIQQDYKIHNLYFSKYGDCNYVEER